MERFGFVGLPNAGKSSLYNALAGGGALAAPYAFATTDPNVGVARVPDIRLDQLSGMSGSKKTVPATVEFVDIARRYDEHPFKACRVRHLDGSRAEPHHRR